MPATGYSGLWGLSYTPIREYSPNNRQLFRWGRQNRKVRALMDALLGAAAGGTAAATQYQVPRVLGSTHLSKIDATARTIINRATTAQDRTDTRDYFSEDSKIATPANRAGTNWRA